MQLCSISMSKMFMQRTLAKWMQMMVDHRHRHFTLLFPLPGRKRSKIFACFLASHYGGFSSDAIYWEWSFLTIPFHEVPQTPCSILPCLVFIALWSLVTVLLLTGWLSLPLAVSTMRVGDLPLWFTTLFQCPESCSVYSRCAWISSWWTDERMKCSCFCCKGKDYLGKDEQLQTKLKTYFT